jgi:DNA-binding transcriptional regulator YhcF (GntR family)
MGKNNILNIRINPKSSTPKYEQLVNEILRHIKSGRLILGDKLPSIHEICHNIDIARDTVVIAYNELKSRGIISPRHGKGFYVASTSVHNKLKIFLLFDVMNGYKEVLYRSFVKNLGKDFQVDIFFHYYNLKVFSQLIRDNANRYGFYVIMPHFNEDVSALVKHIPSDKLLIIDKDIINQKENYAAVYQEFYKDIQSSLKKAHPLLKKYNHFKFISNNNFQFIPDGMEKGFIKFCRDKGINYSVNATIRSSRPVKGDAYLVVSDQDLIEILKISIANNWKPGKDIGIISYDDTPLKEILAGGISVISTDFNSMGKTAAGMIRDNIIEKVENPCRFISRKSL